MENFVLILVVLAGVWLVMRQENRFEPRRDEWQPDVDRVRSAMMHNHHTAGRDR